MNHRLREHDYAGCGFYFITTATYPRRNLFSTISDYKTHLTQFGEIVGEEGSSKDLVEKHIEA